MKSSITRTRFLLIALFLCWPGSVLASTMVNTFSNLIYAVVIITAIAGIFIGPYLYRRALDKKRGSKNLSQFLLSDPETGELLMEDRLKKQGGQEVQSHEQENPPDN